jgi:archaetidylinositol phosphate synthase
MATLTEVQRITAKPAFKEARREVQGLTANVEKRALIAMAERLPAWVTSDQLTALGLAATIVIGVAYVLSASVPAWLHVVNVCLVLNWFGDSLDGTLARVRQTPRPRYGFYVDHIIDAIGALFVFGGLGASGLMSLEVMAVLLITYYLAAIHVYLTTYTAGTFKISYGPIGGTELRIILAAANLVAVHWPVLSIFGFDVKLFDVLGALMIAGMVGMLIVFIPRTSIQLRTEESSVLR